MKVIRKAKEIQDIATQFKKQNKSIGFVPTMGYLHDGHISLIKAAGENDIVIASIFEILYNLGRMKIMKRIHAMKKET